GELVGALFSLIEPPLGGLNGEGSQLVPEALFLGLLPLADPSGVVLLALEKLLLRGRGDAQRFALVRAKLCRMVLEGAVILLQRDVSGPGALLAHPYAMDRHAVLPRLLQGREGLWIEHPLGRKGDALF